MSTLANSVEKVGLLTYATTKGTNVHYAARHIVGYLELPNNDLMIYTTGSDHRLAFDNSSDCVGAKAVLDDVLKD
jgi:hypothetical protein